MLDDGCEENTLIANHLYAPSSEGPMFIAMAYTNSNIGAGLLNLKMRVL